MYKYKEIVAFCVFFSLSFVFMSKVVKNVDPIVSTFITYGIATTFFSAINLKNINEIASVVAAHKGLVFKINISTLVNTLLAFYVVLFVSPLAYVIVFFSGLSFFNTIYIKRGADNLETFVNLLTITLALSIGYLVSNAELLNTVIGLSLTLISTLFGAFYMRESSLLHFRAGITVSQILSIRFYLVIILCGLYSFVKIDDLRIGYSDLGLLLLIAVTGSIIPLFLMQKSIKTLGPKTTSQFTPLTPILCLIFAVLIENQSFSVLEIGLTLLIMLMMLCQTILNHSNIKDKVNE